MLMIHYSLNNAYPCVTTSRTQLFLRMMMSLTDYSQMIAGVNRGYPLFACTRLAAVIDEDVGERVRIHAKTQT